jgi:hypothetical protein
MARDTPISHHVCREYTGELRVQKKRAAAVARHRPSRILAGRGKPALEDIDDCVADFGRREDSSVYKPTPAIDLIFGPDNHFISAVIHCDEAFHFLNLFDQVIDSHGLDLQWREGGHVIIEQASSDIAPKAVALAVQTSKFLSWRKHVVVIPDESGVAKE